MYASRIASVIVVMFAVEVARAQAPADDRSLPTQAYLDHGVTAPDQPWTSKDFEKLITELQRVAQSTPDQLPRMESAKSGKLFARMIATENVTQLAAKDVNFVERWTVLDIGRDLVRIDTIYHGAETAGKVEYQRERFAIVGAKLDCEKVMAQLYVDVVDNGGTNPGRKAFEDQMPQARKEIAHDLEHAIDLMKDAAMFGPANRAIAVASISRNAGLFAFAEPPRRMYLLGLLKKAADDENEHPLKEQMEELVKTATAGKLEPLPEVAGANDGAGGSRLRRTFTDNSLAVDDYYQKGIPPLARPWTPDDLEKVADIIEKISQAKREELPRAQSTKSGTVFAKLVAPENTATLKDKKADFAARAALLRSVSALIKIANAYISAENASRGAFEHEHAAIIAAMIAADSNKAQFANDFVRQGGRSDPHRQHIETNLPNWRQDFTHNVELAAELIGDPIWYDLRARTTVTDALTQNLEPVLVVIDADQRAKVAKLLTDVAAAEPDAKLKEKLNQLVKTANVKRPAFPPPAAPAGRGR